MTARLAFRAATGADIPCLQALAEAIWRGSYAAMLAPAQIDYMLGWMYGAEAIAAEMARGVLWEMAEVDGTAVGFLSFSWEGTEAHLHKLYLLPALQGQGLGQAMLARAKALALRHGAKELRLRVNKGNTRALRSYGRAGFNTVDELVADIGGGFVMDDYVLSLPLPEPKAGVRVKICGLSTAETMETALDAGADQVGLVFFPKSPRHVALDQARDLADQARGRAEVVALIVDATDTALHEIMEAVAPDWLQLHGRETPERVAGVRSLTGRCVMKAIGLSSDAELVAAALFRPVSDRLLFDAKPPPEAVLPGGNGAAFDWTILRKSPPGYVLSGGLTPDNVAAAIRETGARSVDVSSGVESAPGRKDMGKIRAFVDAARQAG